jgi:hypothetical protein
MDAHIGSQNKDNKREDANKTIMDNWKWGCYRKLKSWIMCLEQPIPIVMTWTRLTWCQNLYK